MKSWKDVWYSNVARESSWDLLQAHPYGAGLPEGVSTPRRIPWEYLGRVSCLPGVAVNPPAHSGDEFQRSPKSFPVELDIWEHAAPLRSPIPRLLPSALHSQQLEFVGSKSLQCRQLLPPWLFRGLDKPLQVFLLEKFPPGIS